jgi:hypothetical protein
VLSARIGAQCGQQATFPDSLRIVCGSFFENLVGGDLSRQGHDDGLQRFPIYSYTRRACHFLVSGILHRSPLVWGGLRANSSNSRRGDNRILRDSCPKNSGILACDGFRFCFSRCFGPRICKSRNRAEHNAMSIICNIFIGNGLQDSAEVARNWR